MLFKYRNKQIDQTDELLQSTVTDQDQFTLLAIYPAVFRHIILINPNPAEPGYTLPLQTV